MYDVQTDIACIFSDTYFNDTHTGNRLLYLGALKLAQNKQGSTNQVPLIS